MALQADMSRSGSPSRGGLRGREGCSVVRGQRLHRSRAPLRNAEAAANTRFEASAIIRLPPCNHVFAPSSTARLARAALAPLESCLASALRGHLGACLARLISPVPAASDQRNSLPAAQPFQSRPTNPKPPSKCPRRAFRSRRNPSKLESHRRQRPWRQGERRAPWEQRSTTAARWFAHPYVTS